MYLNFILIIFYIIKKIGIICKIKIFNFLIKTILILKQIFVKYCAFLFNPFKI